MSRVIVRPYQDTDRGLIYSSYAKGVYHGQDFPEDDPNKTQWFQDFHKMVNNQIDTADILMACMEDDSDHILGYSIILGRCLEFVYVKPLYRNQGIANLLTHDRYETVNELHLTKSGQAILSKRSNRAKENNDKQ